MKNLLLAAIVLCFLFSCQKESQNSDTFCFNGTVRWMGEPAADGLGWVLVKDDSISVFQPYVPQNLADEFKVDSLKITACIYETNEKFYCECIQPLKKYRITSIKRR